MAANTTDHRRLVAHRRIVFRALAIGISSLVLYRGLIEVGLSPGGSLRFRGVPLEYLFLTWFLAASALVAYRPGSDDQTLAQITFLELGLSIIGLGGVMYVVQAVHRAELLQSASWTYWIAVAAIVTIFLSSATVPREISAQTLRIVCGHFLKVLTRPATWLCAIGAVAVVGEAPRSLEVPDGGAAFERWYSRQPRAPIPPEWQVSAVTLVAVTDYQCPSCRLVEGRYREVILKAESLYGDRFAFERRDFPLEAECNPTIAAQGKDGVHLAACEAAAAVRLAHQVSDQLVETVVDWLWANQRQLNRELIFRAAEEDFKLKLASSYDSLLASIAAEAESAGRASVAGTPTYFLNGRKLPLLSARGLAAAIEVEVGHVANLDAAHSVRRP